MIERSCSTNKQGIKFEQTDSIIFGYHLHMDVHFLSYLRQFVQSTFIAGRKFLLWIDQYSETVTGSLCRLRCTPYFLVKVIQRIGKEILLCIIKLIQGKKMNALDLISGMSIQSHS